MKTYTNIILRLKQIAVYSLFILVLIVVSCTKEQGLSDDSVIGADKKEEQETEIDTWIKEQITLPYGIEIVYHWEKNNTEVGTYIYPPKIEKVQPALEVVKELLLELYTDKAIGGEDFWKGKNPLKIYLYGGKNLDGNGKELIGNDASVGCEMFIYNVNDFDNKDKVKVYRLVRSVYHQFAKLLAEIYPYDRYKFALISGNIYISSSSEMFSTNISANRHGFFTPYSMLSAENDFAEIISFYLTNPLEEFENAKIAALTLIPGTPEEHEKEHAKEKAEIAHQCLIKKQLFIEEYFSRDVKINIKRLQLLSLQKMNIFLNKQ